MRVIRALIRFTCPLKVLYLIGITHELQRLYDHTDRQSRMRSMPHIFSSQTHGIENARTYRWKALRLSQAAPGTRIHRLRGYPLASQYSPPYLPSLNRTPTALHNTKTSSRLRNIT